MSDFFSCFPLPPLSYPGDIFLFQYNEELLVAESPQKVKYNELILEKDKKGRTVVEVDQSLVRRLKPHQVNSEKPSSAESNI